MALSPFQWWLLLAGLVGLFLVLWLWHLKVHNASLADVGFCLGFWIVVVVCGLGSEGNPVRRMVLVGMGSAYAFRLGFHLFVNRVWRRSEDPRYQTFRKNLGSWQRSVIFLWFQFQVVACVGFAGLLCWVMAHPTDTFRWWDGLGVALFLVAFLGEGVADRQLERFRADPKNKGKTLRSGLWRYSRHPNYFFECLHWWAYVPMAVGLSWWGASIAWPAMMMVCLLWVTGIPWVEQQALLSRGEDYREYQRTTSRLIPWFPKNVS